jgi:nucleoside-diphosphate-sugar epimerase
MRVFVVGGSGAIGTRLVPQLIDRGHEVIGTFKSPGNADRVRAAAPVHPRPGAHRSRTLTHVRGLDLAGTHVERCGEDGRGEQKRGGHAPGRNPRKDDEDRDCDEAKGGGARRGGRSQDCGRS